MESKVRQQRTRTTRTLEPGRPSLLLSASDVARFCQVDLKTVHNWAGKGQIRHSRTPGRHLRFRRLDVLELLRRYGYAAPEELRGLRPRLVILDAEPASVTAVRRAVGRRFDVTVFHDPLDALVAFAQLDPDLLVVNLDLADFDGVHFVARLHALEPTKHIRAFALTRRAQLREAALSAGAVEVMSLDDLGPLRDRLERIVGLDGRKG